MKISQVFVIAHDRDNKLHPKELETMLRANPDGIIQQGQTVVRELEVNSHTLTSMINFDKTRGGKR